MSRRLKNPKELAQDSLKSAISNPLRSTESLLVLSQTAAALYGGHLAMGKAQEVGKGIDKQVDAFKQTAQAVQDLGNNVQTAFSQLYKGIFGTSGTQEILELYAARPEATPQYRLALSEYKSVSANPAQDLFKGLENILVQGAQTSREHAGRVIDASGGSLKNKIKNKAIETLTGRQPTEQDRDNIVVRTELYAQINQHEQLAQVTLQKLLVDYAIQPDKDFYDQATILLEASTTLRKLQYVLSDTNTKIDDQKAQALFQEQISTIQTMSEHTYRSVERLNPEQSMNTHFFESALPVAAAIGVAAVYIGVIRNQRKIFKSIDTIRKKVYEALTVEDEQ